MSWITPLSRRPRHVSKARRSALWIAAICGIALLSTACTPTVPPVEQPPPRGPAERCATCRDQRRAGVADAGRLALP